MTARLIPAYQPAKYFLHVWVVLLDLCEIALKLARESSFRKSIEVPASVSESSEVEDQFLHQSTRDKLFVFLSLRL